uniref:Uncharacterized protein n=1 Tax=Ciona intestinalis TaxID=7719 RepID=F6WXV9_CIOIN
MKQQLSVILLFCLIGFQLEEVSSTKIEDFSMSHVFKTSGPSFKWTDKWNVKPQDVHVSDDESQLEDMLDLWD